MITILINVIIVGLLVWLALWGLGEIGLPKPFDKVARVIVILIAVVYLIRLLLPYIQ